MKLPILQTSTASRLLTFLIACWIFMPAFSASALADKINTGYFGNVAIQGYDTVAYFTEGKAMKGSEAHTVKWLGAHWRFANEKHKDLFLAKPQSFAPQYGGHCATGLAIHGNLTKDIDPEAWTIIDNKLYFNYSKETNKLLTGKVIDLEKSEESWAKAQHVTE